MKSVQIGWMAHSGQSSDIVAWCFLMPGFTAVYEVKQFPWSCAKQEMQMQFQLPDLPSSKRVQIIPSILTLQT